MLAEMLILARPVVRVWYVPAVIDDPVGPGGVELLEDCADTVGGEVLAGIGPLDVVPQQVGGIAAD